MTGVVEVGSEYIFWRDDGSLFIHIRLLYVPFTSMLSDQIA